MGLSLKRVVDERNIVTKAKKSGFTLGLSTLWYDMTEIAFVHEQNKVLQNWFDTGFWFAKRYLTTDSIDPLSDFSDDVKNFFWDIPEFRLDKTLTGGINVRILNPNFSVSYSNLLAAFMNGALDAFNFKMVFSEIKQGIIRLECIKEVKEIG